MGVVEETPKVWRCPRCKTTNFTDGACECCGSAKDWKPAPTPPGGPSAEQLESDRLKREEDMAAREAADIEHRERVAVQRDLAKKKLDDTLAGRIDKPLAALKKRIDDLTTEISELRAEIRALKNKGE